MFDKSKVSGKTACIPGQAEPDSLKNLDDFYNLDDEGIEDSPIPTRPASRGAKRKGKSPSPNKKGKHPMVRVISKMVDDVISTNSITSRAIQGDFTRNDIHEVMNLAKEAGAVQGSDEHYIAIRLFIESENKEVFRTFDTKKGRLNWLKRYYEERKK